MDVKIWANSGDSHLSEPADLFAPPPRRPRRAHAAQRQGRRRPPGDDPRRRPVVPPPDPAVSGSTAEELEAHRAERRRDGRLRRGDHAAPGANDPKLRLVDLDDEGVWAELIYPSIGDLGVSIRDPNCSPRACMVINDWAIEFQRHSPRFVCTATIPLLTSTTRGRRDRTASPTSASRSCSCRGSSRRHADLPPRPVGAGVGGRRGDRAW